MNNKIDEIIEELYKLDPSLKSSGQNLRVIVAELLASKPDVTLDHDFVKNLRSKLLYEAKAPKIQPGNLYSSWISKLLPLGAIAGLIFVLMSGTQSPNIESTAPEVPAPMMLKFDAADSSTRDSAEGAPADSIHNLPVPDAVNAVRVFAAKEANVPEGEILILTAFEKEWPDTCLGLAGREETCGTMIVPGWEITVQIKDKEILLILEVSTR